MCAKSLLSYPTLWDPMDCSPPGASVHGILQARILEWVAMPSSRGSSQPRDRTQCLRHRQMSSLPLAPLEKAIATQQPKTPRRNQYEREIFVAYNSLPQSGPAIGNQLPDSFPSVPVGTSSHGPTHFLLSSHFDLFVSLQPHHSKYKLVFFFTKIKVFVPPLWNMRTEVI